MSNPDSKKRIIYEESVYAAILPVIRMFQGAWMAYLVHVCLTSIFIACNYTDYLAFMEYLGDKSRELTNRSLLKLFFNVPISLWMSILLCRTSRPIGYLLMIYSFFGLMIFTLCLPVIFIGPYQYQKKTEDAPDYWLLLISLLFILSVGGYLMFILFKAGRKIAFANDVTRDIVSEMDLTKPSSFGWISKALCLPFPIKYIKKHRLLSITMFMTSGLAFTCFAMFSFRSILFIITPILAKTFSNTDTLFLHKLYKVLFLGYPSLAIVSLICGLLLRARARKLTIASLRETQQFDPRSPILFLRSFNEDQVKLAAPKLSLLGRIVTLYQAKASLDILLLEEGIAYGPVVALGNPQDSLPPYGASRGYFLDEDWKKGVTELVKDSKFIVICLDQTEGVLWEIELIIALGYVSKTLFLIKPGYKNLIDYQRLLQSISARMTAASPGELLHFHKLNKSEEPVIGFFLGKDNYLKVGVSKEFSEVSYMLMLRWFFRTNYN